MMRTPPIAANLVLATILCGAALPGCGSDDRPSWEQGQPYAEPRAVVGQVDSMLDFEPLSGASVKLVTYEGEFSVATTTTDAKGHYRFADLDDPTYYVIVQHPEHLTDKFSAFAGKLTASLKLRHQSQSPHLMWEPDAPIAPAMQALLGEAIREKQSFALEFGELKALHSELQRVEWEEDDEAGDYTKYAKAKARREAIEKDLSRAEQECMRGMIAHHAAKTGDPRLVQAVKWLAEYRVVERRFAEAVTAREHARAGKKGGTVSEDAYQTTFDAWLTTGREHGEWRDRSASVLDPAKRALMALRAKKIQR